MTSQTVFDVLVVGGGPAGCAAAQTARRLGRTVAVVERGTAGGEHRRAVERLAPMTRQPLADWGLLARMTKPVADDCAGVVSAWNPDAPPRVTHGLLDPYGGGWIVERHEFDALLRREAVRLGAVLVSGHAVSVVACASGWTLEYEHCDRMHTVHGGRLVLASGGAGSLRRTLTPGSNRSEKWVAVLGRVRHCSRDWRDDACLFIEKTPHGWMYGMPAPAGGAFVGVCVSGPWLARQRPRDVWRRTLACSRIGDACEPARDAQVWCRPMRGPAAVDVAGHSWAIAGDAAHCVDPLSGLGVAFALESGRRAVETPDSYGAWVRSFRAQHDETRTEFYSETVDLLPTGG